jgi:hypothetical protein
MYWEDFYEPSEFPCLKLMVAYLNLHMPGSEEMHLAQHLLFQWEFLEPSETAYEGEEPGFACWAHEEWSVQGPTVWTFHFMRWARRNEEPVTPQHLDHSLGCVLLCSQGSGFSGRFLIFESMRTRRSYEDLVSSCRAFNCSIADASTQCRA